MRVQASGDSGGSVDSSFAADEHELEELFRRLDVNKDGRIDIHDLSEALRRLEVPEFADHAEVCSELNGSVKEPNFSIYVFFSPITQWCSISDVLFTGGRVVSDFSVLKYY